MFGTKSLVEPNDDPDRSWIMYHQTPLLRKLASIMTTLGSHRSEKYQMEALTETFWTILYLEMLFIATEYDTKRLSVIFLPTPERRSFDICF